MYLIIRTLSIIRMFLPYYCTVQLKDLKGFCIVCQHTADNWQTLIWQNAHLRYHSLMLIMPSHHSITEAESTFNTWIPYACSKQSTIIPTVLSEKISHSRCPTHLHTMTYMQDYGRRKSSSSCHMVLYWANFKLTLCCKLCQIHSCNKFWSYTIVGMRQRHSTPPETHNNPLEQL